MRSLFEDVKGQVDPRQILEALLGPPDRSRKWRCGLHDDKRPSLSEKEGGIVCFGCGFRGDIFRFIRELETLTSLESVRRVADLAGILLPEGRPPSGWPSSAELQERRIAQTLRAETERLAREIEKEAGLAIADEERAIWETGQEYQDAVWERMEDLAALQRVALNVEDKPRPEAEGAPNGARSG